jgi:hypothetical protein
MSFRCKFRFEHLACVDSWRFFAAVAVSVSAVLRISIALAQYGSSGHAILLRLAVDYKKYNYSQLLKI